MNNPIGTMMTGIADIGLQIGGGIFLGLLSIAIAMVIVGAIQSSKDF